MIRQATFDDLLYVAGNLREADRIELAATRPDTRAFVLASDAYRSPWGWVAMLDGRPVMTLGANPVHRGVVQMWGFGTPEFKRVIVEMTKHAKEFMFPTLISAGYHRAQCLVHSENRASHRWLKSLGFYREANLRGFGSSREDFFLYAWVNDEPGQKADA